MKKLSTLLIFLIGSVSFAEAPSLKLVAETILRDGGYPQATLRSDVTVGTEREGVESSSRHMLTFRLPDGDYTCDMSFFKPRELKQEKYLIQAEMDNCTDPNGDGFSLSKDHADFKRVFHVEDSKWHFDPLSEDDKILASKRTNRTPDWHETSRDGIHSINDKLIIKIGSESAILGN